MIDSVYQGLLWGLKGGAIVMGFYLAILVAVAPLVGGLWIRDTIKENRRREKVARLQADANADRANDERPRHL